MSASPDSPPKPPTDIAIIGMSGQFPGAPDLEAFWQLLRDGRDAISRFSDSELAEAGIPSAVRSQPGYVAAHGILDAVEYFDTDFFGIPPHDAELIDPQQRLFMVQSLRALEQAGYDSRAFPGRIGVWAGVSTNTYVLKHIMPTRPPRSAAQDLKIMVGNDKDFLTTRAAYQFDLRGPCCSVQTACSSSLVAVHMACEALASGECDMALAGGVTLKLPQITGYLHEPGAIFSADGRVCAFSAEASGTVLGNGVGLVVLKPLAHALRDRDRIRAVVKGSAVNNDGAYKASYESLGKAGQVRVIRDAHRRAGVSPGQISYLEAHGTGTILGDALEVSALTEAFGGAPQDGPFCGLGSVKSNIGHLDAAAGIAALIKTVLMLEHREMAPSLHFSAPNPNITFKLTPFFVVDAVAEWKADTGPLRAGVSAFGIGGTNAHVVLEVAPPTEPDQETRKAQVITLSAESERALAALKTALSEHLDKEPAPLLADVCYTLNRGRPARPFRAAFAARDAVQLKQALRKQTPPRENPAGPRRPLFAFTGFDKPQRDLGLCFYLEEPDFRERVDEAADLIRQLADTDPLKLLYPGWKGNGAGHGALQAPRTALLIYQCALAHLWNVWGLGPAALIGQGSGALAAAVVARALPLETALRMTLPADGIAVPPPKLDLTEAAQETIPLYSTETGALWRLEELEAPALARSTAEGEAFHDACARLLSAQGDACLLELGPKTVLGRRPERMDGSRIDVFTAGDADLPGDEQLLHALATLAGLWQAGCMVDWNAFYRDESRGRVPLPGHPLFGERVWLDAPPPSQPPQAAQISEPAPEPAGAEPRTGITPGEGAGPFVRALVAGLLDRAPSEIDMAKGFFEHGLSSLHLLSATTQLQRCVDENFLPAAFFECATLDDLAAHLAEAFPEAFSGDRPGPRNSAGAAQTITSQPHARFDPFPLSDLQQAFLSGRKLGGMPGLGCHIYLELELESLDIFRLSQAWTRLIAHHDMLRCVILRDGSQQVLDEVPDFHFRVQDLRGLGAAEQAARRLALRERLSHRVYDPAGWPFFDIAVTLDAVSHRVHFSIDECIADATSLYLLLAQWSALYQKLEDPLPAVPISFRDFTLWSRTLEQQAPFTQHIAHFLERLTPLPPTPGFVSADPAHWSAARRTRLQSTLTVDTWRRLRARLGEMRLDPSAFLLTLFSEVLLAHNEGADLALILTLANRHRDARLGQAVGPFFSSMIFAARNSAAADLRGAAAEVQQRLYEDLGHTDASGVRVLRELRQSGAAGRGVTIPIVFTSLITESGSVTEAGLRDRIGFMITQTPQVCLDCQVSETGGALILAWDVVEEAFAPAVPGALFDAFLTALRGLADEPSNWPRPSAAGRSLDTAPPAGLALRLERRPERDSQPFSLTAQQLAYAYGRTPHGGASATPLYFSIHCAELDLGRLNEAWRRTHQRHPMLAARIHPNGTQQIGVAAPEQIAFTDLRDLSATERDRRLEELRDEMMGAAPATSRPNAQLRVTRTGPASHVLHLCIDMIVADASSCRLVIETLLAAYAGTDDQTDRRPYVYSDYMHALKALEGTPRHAEALRYWERKMDRLPAGPALPQGAAARRHVGCELVSWRKLNARAELIGVPLRSVLLTVYSQVLAAWSSSPSFTLAVPCWARPPVPGLDLIVGDFTAMSWLVVDREPRSFETRARAVETGIAEDLARRPVSGLRALRRAAKQGAARPGFPIVFTDFDLNDIPRLPAGFALGASSSRTPQTHLDCVTEADGEELRLRWDSAPEVFPEGLIEAMFAGYRRAIEYLRDVPRAWSGNELQEIIAAEPERFTQPPGPTVACTRCSATPDGEVEVR